MGEYIDKEKLLEELRLQCCNDCTNYHELQCRFCDVDSAIGIVEDAPKVDVQKVKYARWKGAGMGAYYCSLCQEEYSGGNRFHYCPNCGAKMDGDVG